MKSSRLDTGTSVTKPEQPSFVGGSEWTELKAELGEAPQLTWEALASSVRTSLHVGDVTINSKKPLPSKAKLILLAHAAFEVKNTLLLREIEKSPSMSEFLTPHYQILDEERVETEALKVSIEYELENFACHFAQVATMPVPLYVIHRAGERGMLQFLKCLADFKTKVVPSRVLASVVFRARILLRRRNNYVRFQSAEDYLLPEDVLKWALIRGGEAKVKEVLQWGLDVPDAALVNVLLAEGMLELFNELFAAERLCLCPKVTLHMLTWGHIRTLVGFVEKSRSWFVSRTPAMLRSAEVVEKLIALVSEIPSALPALRLLKFVQGSDWTLVETEAMHAKALELLSSQNAEDNPIANHCNPLMFSVAMSEMCEHLSSFKLLFREKFQLLARQYRDLAGKIQSQYVEYRQLKVLYTERIFGAQCLFDVITGNTERYRALLRSEIVVSIMQDLWSGGVDSSLDFEPLCFATRYFGRERQSLFKLHGPLSDSTKCIFRLEAWKKNGSLKFFSEALGLLVVFALMTSSSVSYTGIMQVLRSNSSPQAIQQAIVQMESGRMMITAYSTFSATLVLYVLQKLSYQRLLGQRVTLPATDIADILLFMLALFNQIASLPEVSSLLDSEVLRQVTEPSFAAMFLLAGFRMCLTLLITRAFGPMIRMVFVIMRDIATFLGIYLVALTSFAVFFSNLFYMTPEFSSLAYSFRTLFQWSVSGLDSSVFVERQVEGSLLSAVWMFVSAVILLNLLIAVLSSRYEQLAPQCTADYVSILYKNYNQTHYEPPFGALVMSPAPFTVATLPLLPIYFFFPGSARRLDGIFVVISYQGMFLAGFIAFLLYSLAYACLAYFYVCTEIVRKSGLRGGSRLLTWVLLAPGYLCFLVGLSMANFCRCMYRDPPAQDSEAIPEEVLQPARKFLLAVCTAGKACRLSLEDIAATTANFPVLSSHSKPQSQPSTAFGIIAKQVIGIQPRLSAAKRAHILEFFGRFKSYSGEMSEETGHGSVDAARMLRFLKMYSSRTDKLAAVNLYFTQKALTLLQAEHNLKRRRGKSR